MKVEDKEERGIPQRVWLVFDETTKGRMGIPETRLFFKEAPATVGLPIEAKREGKKEGGGDKRDAAGNRDDVSEDLLRRHLNPPPGISKPLKRSPILSHLRGGPRVHGGREFYADAVRSCKYC